MQRILALLLLVCTFSATGCTGPRAAMLYTVVTNDVPMPMESERLEREVNPVPLHSLPSAMVRMHVSLPPEETVAWYREALPKAGWALAPPRWAQGRWATERQEDPENRWANPGTDGASYYAWRERTCAGIPVAHERLLIRMISKGGGTVVRVDLRADYLWASQAGQAQEFLWSGAMAAPGVLSLPFVMVGFPAFFVL